MGLIILNLSVRNMSGWVLQHAEKVWIGWVWFSTQLCDLLKKHFQVMDALLEPLRGIIKSCLFIAFVFKFWLCLSAELLLCL